MIRIAFALLLLASSARAQSASVTEQPPVIAGYGSLTATTTSATVASLITNNANSVATWPTASGFAPAHIWVRNVGGNNVSFCPFGGTCSCASNATVNTTGVTILAGGYYGFTLQSGGSNLAYNISTIVSCTGSDQVEVDIQ